MNVLFIVLLVAVLWLGAGFVVAAFIRAGNR